MVGAKLEIMDWMQYEKLSWVVDPSGETNPANGIIIGVHLYKAQLSCKSLTPLLNMLILNKMAKMIKINKDWNQSDII